MSIIDLPTSLAVQRQDFGIRTFDLTFANGDTGSSQVAVLAPPRRTCALVSEDRIPVLAQAAVWRALMHAMDGQVNVLAVSDLLQPAPRGTARGAWTAAAAAAGAASLTINMGAAQAGKTLLQGDWIGVNQTSIQRQLLHVQADAVANAAGQIMVQFKPGLRVAVAAASAVVWDRPTCLMRKTDSQSKWSSSSRTQGGFSLDLMESWE
ncbi:hypothetical protein [Variovorax paradoxus]|uniref:Uncharacterized protein n=1 Tax=Variovorax paradoxus TaxID=34073 RepID=A0A0H2M647_VARPD|nr:hypothetical protein [Variovorax paradoxus]KLN57616.1 hypothetical protein VPARA_11290 [Variovorax paradoxus]